MELIELYKHLFDYAGWEPDDNGFARVKGGDDTNRVHLDSKAIALPFQVHLNNPDPDKKIIFHPLAEYSHRGESVIIKKLKSNINTTLGLRFGYLGSELLSIAADPAQQKKLTPAQMEIVIAIKDATGKSVTDWNNVTRRLLLEKPDRGFLNIHLRRGGEYMGDTYPRVGLTVFPYHRELCTDNGDTGNIRKKDIDTFKQVYHAILPEVDMAEAYNYGYKGQVAPFLCTLLFTSAKIASRLNEIVDLFGDLIASGDRCKSNLEWLPVFNNNEGLVALARQIPMQEGNDGQLIPTNTAAPAPAAPAAPTGYVPPYAQPPAYPQPGYPQPGYPANGWAPPPYGAPPPAAPAKDPYSSKGLSFKDLCASNPALATAPNLLGSQIAMKQAADAARAQAAHYAGQYGQPYGAPYGAPPAYGYGVPPTTVVVNTPGYGPMQGPPWY